MTEEIYRLNAGIVVFNRERKVLLCRRSDEVEDAWQFPQGGIEKGELPQQAAARELKEETSITSVKWVKTLTDSVKYRFPPEVLAFTRSLGWKNVGQDMYLSLFYFYGDDSEINLNTPGQEFDAYRWGTLQEAYDLIVDFKKTVYAVAQQEFSNIIAQYPLPK
jgi:putative (di)nucleoside polyphosphate hydrolase